MKHALLQVGFVLLLTACGSDGGESPAPGSGGSSGAASGGSGNGGSASGGASGAGGLSTGGASSGGTAGAGGGGPSDKRVGDPCTTDAECPALGLTTPVCMKTWPGGGSCSATGCAGSDLQCANVAVCANYLGANRCLAFCISDAACRTGYKCSPDFSACIPAS